MSAPAQAPPAASRGSAPPELARLRKPDAVRERCGIVHRWVAEDRSPHLALEESRLAAVAGYVADVTREAYPALEIPYHSRWRHFSTGGVDRWEALAAGSDPIERARMAIDLVTVSVLLDAGAGDAWRYREQPTGLVHARSEGLAVASLDMFRAGGFSADARHPLRVDGTALAGIDPVALARHFQADGRNPLVGLEGRSALLRRLATALTKRPDLFGEAPARPGNLVDYLRATATDRRVTASMLLTTLLDAFSSIWPSGLAINGFPVGDAGRHSAIRTADASDHIVPFHKLSQWLAYSLIEPLESAGLAVQGLDQLTALPEYRNGGLLIDLGVICPRRPIDPRQPYESSSELIVEWRALTVALMDRLLELVRDELGVGAGFTMPQLLQGGTWSAGRRIARSLRPPEGPPPIPVATDGTVF